MNEADMSVTFERPPFTRDGTRLLKADWNVDGLPVAGLIAGTTSWMIGAPCGRYIRIGTERMLFASGTRLASNVLVVVKTGDVLFMDGLPFALEGDGTSLAATVQNLLKSSASEN